MSFGREYICVMCRFNIESLLVWSHWNCYGSSCSFWCSWAFLRPKWLEGNLTLAPWCDHLVLAANDFNVRWWSALIRVSCLSVLATWNCDLLPGHTVGNPLFSTSSGLLAPDCSWFLVLTQTVVTGYVGSVSVCVCVCVSVITFVLWGSDCIIAVCKLCWGFCQLCCHCTGAPHFKICLLTMYPGYHNFNLLYILTEVAWEGMDALAQCMGREFPKSYVQNP